MRIYIAFNNVSYWSALLLRDPLISAWNSCENPYMDRIIRLINKE